MLIITGAFPQKFPLKLVWLSSALLLCGGGLNSASAYMWASASDSIPTERRQVLLIFKFCSTNTLDLEVMHFTIYSLHGILRNLSPQLLHPSL